MKSDEDVVKGKLSARIRSWLSYKRDQRMSKILLSVLINEENSKVARHLVQKRTPGTTHRFQRRNADLSLQMGVNWPNASVIAGQ